MDWPKHLKKTPARMAVYELFKLQSSPLSVDEIQTHLKEVHLTTLYRIVEDFEKAHLISLTDEFNPKKKRYRLQTSAHHHTIKCIECGKEEALEACPVHVHAPNHFIVLNHRLEVEGLCQSCAKKHQEKQ